MTKLFFIKKKEWIISNSFFFISYYCFQCIKILLHLPIYNFSYILSRTIDILLFCFYILFILHALSIFSYLIILSFFTYYQYSLIIFYSFFTHINILLFYYFILFIQLIILLTMLLYKNLIKFLTKKFIYVYP